ncbi:3-beta-glucosidase, partial [Durusdinium trenchii]
MSLTPCTAFIPGHLPLQPARHSCTSHTWPKTAAVAVLIAPRTRSVRGWKQRAFLRSGVVSQAPELLEAESEEERLQRMLLDLGEFELLEGSSSELLQRAFTSLRNTKGGKEAKERLPSSSELLGLFASAVLQDPSNVEAIFGMGVFLEVSHRPMEMLRWMDLVLELQPKHLGAWEARSRAQEHRGRLSEALAGYRQLASLDTARTRPRDALLEHQQVYVL